MLTEEAQGAIRSIVEEAGVGPNGGLRISGANEGNGETALEFDVAHGPADGDEVVTDGGATVFLDETASALLPGDSVQRPRPQWTAWRRSELRSHAGSRPASCGCRGLYATHRRGRLGAREQVIRLAQRGAAAGRVGDDIVERARECAHIGLHQPLRLTPQDKLVEIVRKSQELALAGEGGEDEATASEK